jgi:hypothetical protein
LKNEGKNRKKKEGETVFEYIIEEESTLKSYNCMVLIAS